MRRRVCMSDELPVVGCARYSALISLLQTHPSSLSIFILGLGPCHFFTPLPAAHLWGQSARGPEWSWNAVRGRKFSRLSVLASCSCQNALSDGLSPAVALGSRFQVFVHFPTVSLIVPSHLPSTYAKAPLLTDVGISSVVSMLSPGALRARRTGPAGR